MLLSYLVIGLLVSDRYGISFDEHVNRLLGQQTLDYALGWIGSAVGEREAGAPELPTVGAEQGPAFELVLAALERVSGLEDTRDIYLMRHRATFLAYWCGALAFFLLLRRVLEHDGLALLGAALLIVTPRLFADAFYNSKDTVLLAMFVVSTHTLVRLMQDRTVLGAMLHALACAATIDIRLVGLLLPAVTLACLALEAVANRRERALVRRLALLSGVYAVCSAAFVLLLWPQLWEAPLSGFFGALSRLSEARQVLNAFALYRGRFVSVHELPWHYLPTWMTITTPPLTGALLLAGLVLALRTLLVAPLADARNRWLVLFLVLFCVPVGLVITLRPVLYDGWRHLYFVYPALVAIAMLGLRGLCSRPLLRVLTSLVALLALGHSLLILIRYHPHQQVYFNGLASRDVERRFELDYWGLSFRDGLLAIIEREPSGIIPVAVSDLPGVLNAMILPEPLRARIRFVSLDQARYFVSNHRSPEQHRRFLAGEAPYRNEVYTLRVGGAHILGVYDLR